jgi:UDP-N-acetylglucosamine 2-epimerase
VIEESDKVLRKELPDAFLLYGDTNSCLSVISAKRLKIPIFHMEAGNRCFDQRVPEEINRKIVDHLSDINLPLSEHARNYLINEGISPETIFKTGSPMKEVLEYYAKGIEESRVLEIEGLEPKEYFVVSTHREENVDSERNFQDLLDSLDALVSVFGKKVIVSTHPRTKKRLESLNRLASDGVSFMKPFGFNDYIKLQQNAFCVISDSGTITEENAILGFPAVMIRQAHERPEGMDTGTLIMAGLQKERIIECVNIVTTRNGSPKIVPDYDITDVSYKVLNIIMSYTDYVNRTVWKKGY